MSIATKVRMIERLFDRLDRETTKFRTTSSLHCLAGCGKCCTKPDIDASPLEFLPWAYHLFLKGEALRTIDLLAKEPHSICHIYLPLSITESTSGSCGDYQYRGLICRLFGYAASRDKSGQLRLGTCKIIKEDQSESYISTQQAIENGLYVPVFSDYYARLNQIDFRLGNMLLPINQALKVALEEVLHYYAYRPLPRGFKDAA